MTTLRKVATQALEVLELVTDLTNHDDEIYDAIDALKAALAEPVQDGKCKHCVDGCPACDARKLTDEEIERIRFSERERLIRAVESVPPHRWVDGSDQWGNPCPAKVVATKSDYVAAMRAADKRNVPTLVEPVQEPVAWIQPDHLQKARVAPFLCRVEPTQRCSDFVALYTASPQRKPLTREEAIALWADKSDGPSNSEIVLYCRAIERAHGIK